MTVPYATIGRFDEVFLTSPFVQDPYPLYDELRTAEPVAWSERMKSWVLLRMRDVKAAGRTQALGQGDRTSAYVRNLPETDRDEIHPICAHMPRFTSFLDPPEHTVQRGLLSHAFTPKVVEDLRPAVHATSAQLVEDALLRGEMDLVSEFALPLACTTISEMLGVPVSDRQTFVGWVETIFAYLGSEHSDPGLARACKAAYGEVVSYLGERLAERRRHPQDDLIGKLAAMELAGEIGEANVYPLLIGLLQGGFETTTSTISSGLHALLSHPDQWHRLRAERGLVASAVEEFLRYEPSLQYVTRTALIDIEFGNKTIAAGESVMMMLGAANRDAEAFDEPHRFDVAREPNRHVTFGIGVHFCMGAALARLQAHEALGLVLERITEPELSRPADEYRWKHSGLLRQLVAAPVRL